MKYGLFLKMRFLSFAFSKMKTKNPFPTKWLLIPSVMSGIQVLYTKASTNLGEGHRPVNWPMSPLSTRLTVDLYISSTDNSIMGM